MSHRNDIPATLHQHGNRFVDNDAVAMGAMIL